MFVTPISRPTIRSISSRRAVRKITGMACPWALDFCTRIGFEKELVPTNEAHRRAFQLAIAEQHSYADVARQTGWSLSQVKINVYRARKRLIAGLRDYLPQGD